MNHKNWTLLTGGTGFLGTQLLHELLHAGHQVAILIRGNGFSPSERFDLLRHSLPFTDANRVRLIAGDLLDKALLNDHRGWLKKNCQRVIHSAGEAVLDRHAPHAAVNVRGTERLLQLMDATDIAEMHYISSAYQCGLRPQEVVFEAEGGNRGGVFRNAYEESTHLAECAVARSMVPSKTIYRPVVVVGDSRSGAASRFRTFYQLVRFAHHYGKYAEGPTRIALEGDEPVNLAPIDWVAKSIVHLVGRPSLHGRTFHLAPRMAYTAREISEAIQSYFGLPQCEFVGKGTLDNPNRIERYLPDYLNVYASYYGTDCYFDTTNTDAALGAYAPPPRMLERLIDFAVRTQFGRRPADIVSRVRRMRTASEAMSLAPATKETLA